jgi:hypothetical protein
MVEGLSVLWQPLSLMDLQSPHSKFGGYLMDHIAGGRNILAGNYIYVL